MWKGGTWSELNRTKVYSIVKKLSSAKVGNPLYLNSSHVVRAKPLQRPSSLYSISSIAHDTPTCTAYFDTPTAHVRRFPHVIDVARDGVDAFDICSRRISLTVWTRRRSEILV